MLLHQDSQTKPIWQNKWLENLVQKKQHINYSKYIWYSDYRERKKSNWCMNTWCRNILRGLHSSPVKHFLCLKQWRENLSPEAGQTGDAVYSPPKNPFLLLSNLWLTVLKQNRAFRTLEQRSIPPQHMITILFCFQLQYFWLNSGFGKLTSWSLVMHVMSCLCVCQCVCKYRILFYISG